MTIPVLESDKQKAWVCRDCGETFDIPDSGEMCPYCYSDDISHSIKPEPKLVYLKSFSSRKPVKSMVAKKRYDNPVEDCLCCVIWSSYSRGYYIGEETSEIQGRKYRSPIFNPDIDMAVVFVNRKSAESKIDYGNLHDCTVEKAKIIDNTVYLNN